jgi:hypothetical protein
MVLFSRGFVSLAVLYSSHRWSKLLIATAAYGFGYLKIYSRGGDPGRMAC